MVLITSTIDSKINELSCGIILFRKQDDKREYLLVKSTTSGNWGFSKGHANEQESELETALREVKEETNLSPQIIKGFRREVNYFTQFNTLKKVIYFLGKCNEQDKPILDLNEIQNSSWLRYDYCMHRLLHLDQQQILQQAQEYLSNLK